MQINELTDHNIIIVKENINEIRRNLNIYQAISILNYQVEESSNSLIDYILDELNHFEEDYDHFLNKELTTEDINYISNNAYLINENYTTLKNDLSNRYRYITFKMFENLELEDIKIFKKYLIKFLDRYGSGDLSKEYIFKQGSKEVKDFINQIEIYIKNYFIADLYILNHLRKIVKFKDATHLSVNDWLELYTNIDAIIMSFKENNNDLYQILILSYYDFLVDYFIMVSCK